MVNRRMALSGLGLSVQSSINMTKSDLLGLENSKWPRFKRTSSILRWQKLSGLGEQKYLDARIMERASVIVFFQSIINKIPII